VRLSRRRFLALLAAGAAGGCTGGDDAAAPAPTPAPTGASSTTTTTTTTTPPSAPPVEAIASPPVELPGDPFMLGVASGDPVADAVVLWTRLAPDPLGGGGMPDADVPVVWELGEDEAFGALVATGTAVASPASAHSLHVDVTGLAADRWYHYRFRTGPFTSAVGRARTASAPGAAAGRLVLALASCQDYGDGYYTPYRHLVADAPDVVVFVGDYVYERGGAGPVRDAGGPAEALDLAGYRARYGRYRADPELQAAHHAAPWIVAWDDHEVRNDYAGGATDDPVPAARRAAAYQAWWEHMPVRLPPPDGAEATVHRELRFGALATVLVLDTRQFRSAPACGGGLSRSCEGLAEPGRTMLGADQQAWLTERLAATEAIWTVLAQQVVVADAVVVGFVNTDQWDGYPAARSELLAAVRDSGAANPVVLTGDLHAGLVADLRAGDEVVATEFVGTSISSRFPTDLETAFGALTTLKDDIAYVNAARRGYLRCTLTAEQWRSDYRVVATTEEPTSEVSTDASFVVRAGTPGAVRA